MSATPPTPPVEPGTWTGGEGSAHVRAVLAPNPSPMTLEGTNTWVIGDAGASSCVVVDPGPPDEGHLAAIEEVVDGRRVEAVLLTHRHPDHSEGAGVFAERVRSRVRAEGPGADDLTDGDVIVAGDLEIGVLATPGHTRDSVCFYVGADDALLTGDTVLGWGTTMVAWPDGRLDDYLASLDRLAGLTGSGRVRRFLPGHGAYLPDADASVHFYLDHRRERLDQVRQAVEGGATDVQSVLEVVYADVPRELWPAASRSVEAQLHHLRGTERS
ncbi:MBL fold metallo-hydrolase [Mobilicoccus massiliensis]|uniref:MBL fold metallo-hydrolase n=1 Tax=Mobilicoccus massiliensis TaxID=1522310 RepID=UPI00058FD3DF|nr:MBL fold metallo-hydrolase [Mobilicoccus massiliensis]